MRNMELSIGFDSQAFFRLLKVSSMYLLLRLVKGLRSLIGKYSFRSSERNSKLLVVFFGLLLRVISCF